MPTSTPGSGTPMRPRKPPSAITMGNVTGRSQIAGAPSCAPQRPTAIIASTWSRPEIGVREAGKKSRRLARLHVGEAQARPSVKQYRRGNAMLHGPSIISTSLWIVQKAPSEPTA